MMGRGSMIFDAYLFYNDYDIVATMALQLLGSGIMWTSKRRTAVYKGL